MTDWLHTRLGRDSFMLYGFYMVLAAAAVISLAGIMLTSLFTGHERQGFDLTLIGTIFFSVCAAIILFCFVDPSPQD